MGTIYIVKRPDGRQCAHSSTRTHANREIKWQLASGFPGPFVVEREDRGDSKRWGHGAPHRAGFKWCGAKHLEFLKRYIKGEYIIDLAIHFDTSEVVVCRKAREFGFNYRIDDPRTFEQHRGRWTDREEELVNFMYDEAVPIGKISEHHPRTKGAISARLDTTAGERSTRSQFGRFIVHPGSGRRGISPVMEEAGSDPEDI